MSATSNIESHLPLLRRYAHALVGPQGAEAYVRATIELIRAEPRAISPALPAKVALFQLFHKVWLLVDPSERADCCRAAGADKGFKTLTPLSRQVILLTTMDGFSREEIAQILHTDAENVAALSEEAQRQLGATMSARILLIEDEPIIALDIAALAEDLGHKITGVAATRSEAVAAAKAVTPDLVLADIKLADKSSGLDAARDILKQIELPIIIVTAFPERLLVGRQIEPTFVITKPFAPAELRIAISQALFFHQNARRP